jgi:hypothetical protein
VPRAPEGAHVSALRLAPIWAAALLLAPTSPRRAEAACPPPSPTEAGRPFLVTPADGDRDVPANALLLIHWPDAPFICESPSGCSGQHGLVLRDADEHTVPIFISTFLSFGPEPRQTRQVTLVPQSPLTPTADYHVVWVHPDGLEETMGRFSAGAPMHQGPPAPPTITGVEVSPLHTCGVDDFGCCGDTPVRRVTLTIAAADEPVTYSTTFFDRDAADQREITGLFYCDARPQFDFLSAPGVTTPFVIGGGAHQLAITARARNGSSSTPATINVYASCDPDAPDAGPLAVPADAAMPDAGSGPAPRDDGGCAIGLARSPRHVPGTVSLVVLAVLALRRRTRASRRGFALAGLLLCACAADHEATSAGGLTAAPACDVPRTPYLLVSLATCPHALTLDDTHVYWIDSKLARFPKCGSANPPESLSALATGYDLAVDADAIYYLSGADLIRLPKDGSPASVLLRDREQGFQQLTADADAVYVSTDLVCIVGQPCGDDRGLLWRAAKDGSAVDAVIRTGGFQLFDVVVDDSEAFFAGNVKGVDGQLGRVAKLGGTPEALRVEGASSSPTALAVDGDALYVGAGAQVYRVGKSGQGASRLAEEPLAVEDLAVDDEYVYWATSDDQNGGQVRRVSKLGGAAETLADAPDPHDVVVDRGAIYFTTCAHGFAAGVWIMAR